MRKMLLKNLLFISASLTLCSAVIPTGVVFAEQYTISKEMNQFNTDYRMSREELKDYGLSDEQIKEFQNYTSKNIVLINGEGYRDGIVLSIDSRTRGKFTWAVKAIRKVYNKLPTKVKKVIATYTGLNGFLQLIEHYTGTLENAIYNACRKVGMPLGTANFVTKTIMLFI